MNKNNFILSFEIKESLFLNPMNSLERQRSALM